MSEEQKAFMTEEQEKEDKSPVQEAANSEQEPGSKDDSSPQNQDEKKKRSRIKVRGVYHMPPYFWGSLKAFVSISIPGFMIRGIRIVQEKDEEEFHIYPPQGWVGREQKSIVKIHNREFWAQICEEVSNAYVISREKWEEGRNRRRLKQLENSQEAEMTPQETQAESVA